MDDPFGTGVSRKEPALFQEGTLGTSVRYPRLGIASARPLWTGSDCLRPTAIGMAPRTCEEGTLRRRVSSLSVPGRSRRVPQDHSAIRGPGKSSDRNRAHGHVRPNHWASRSRAHFFQEST